MVGFISRSIVITSVFVLFAIASNYSWDKLNEERSEYTGEVVSINFNSGVSDIYLDNGEKLHISGEVNLDIGKTYIIIVDGYNNLISLSKYKTGE
jgi:hypothetical protein